VAVGKGMSSEGYYREEHENLLHGSSQATLAIPFGKSTLDTRQGFGRWRR